MLVIGVWRLLNTVQACIIWYSKHIVRVFLGLHHRFNVVYMISNNNNNKHNNKINPKNEEEEEEK